MASLSETFGFDAEKEQIQSKTKKSMLPAAIIMVEAMLLSLLCDTSLPVQAKRQKLEKQTNKVSEYSDFFNENVKAKIQRTLMTRAMQIILG